MIKKEGYVRGMRVIRSLSWNEMKILDLQLTKYEINDHQDSRFYREVKHRKIVFYVYRESHNAINNAIKTAKSGLPLVS